MKFLLPLLTIAILVLSDPVGLSLNNGLPSNLQTSLKAVRVAQLHIVIWMSFPEIHPSEPNALFRPPSLIIILGFSPFSHQSLDESIRFCNIVEYILSPTISLIQA